MNCNMDHQIMNQIARTETLPRVRVLVLILRAAKFVSLLKMAN